MDQGPNRDEVSKLTIALGKTISEFLKRRGESEWRHAEAMNALALLAVTVMATGNAVQTAQRRAIFESYLDEAMTQLDERIDDAPKRLN